MINEDVAKRLTYVWNNDCVKCFTGSTARLITISSMGLFKLYCSRRKLALSHIIMRKQ